MARKVITVGNWTTVSLKAKVGPTAIGTFSLFIAKKTEKNLTNILTKRNNDSAPLITGDGSGKALTAFKRIVYKINGRRI